MVHKPSQKSAPGGINVCRSKGLGGGGNCITRKNNNFRNWGRTNRSPGAGRRITEIAESPKKKQKKKAVSKIAKATPGVEINPLFMGLGTKKKGAAGGSGNKRRKNYEKEKGRLA